MNTLVFKLECVDIINILLTDNVVDEEEDHRVRDIPGPEAGRGGFRQGVQGGGG